MTENIRELPMTPGEIVTSYKQAANPKEQIKILADLNAATTDEIMEVLNFCGVEVPSRRTVSNWSKAEETLLRDLAAEGKTAEQVAEMLGRTVKSVVAKAIKMKLQLHNYQRSGDTKAPPEGTRDKVLTREDLTDRICWAIGEELPAGNEARLTDMLAALGYSVVKHFVEGDEHV